MKRRKADDFIPTEETKKWDEMLKTFVLNGLYREIKISFNEEREVLAHNSPVFYRIKKRFSEGMKEVDHIRAETFGLFE